MAGKGASPISGSNNEPVNSNSDAASESGNAGIEHAIIDPATLGGSGGGTDNVGEYGPEYERDDSGNLVIGANGKPRKRRGRKSGGGSVRSGGGSSGGSGGSPGKSGARNSQAIIDGVDTLSKTLLIVHMGLASYTKFDAMQLAKEESDALAASLVNVMDQFDFAPDPRFTAVAGLVTTAATIYGPRVYLYKEHAKELAKQKAVDKAVMQPPNVEQFQTQSGPIDMGPGGAYGNLGG